MEPKDFVYNYIEFFFSKTDLHSMMTIKPLSYENWLESVHDIYSVNPYLADPPMDKNKFHYNIMHTPAYIEIINSLRKINDFSHVDETNQSNKTEAMKIEETKAIIQKNKENIEREFENIKKKYKELYYYDEIYVYAHYVFNNIRKIPNLGIQKGGGHAHLTLEEFKQIIREKIKMLDL